MTVHTGHSVIRTPGSVAVEATANVVWLGQRGQDIMIHPTDVPDLIDALRDALADHEALRDA